MRSSTTSIISLIVSLTILSAPLFAQESSWTKVLENRAKRNSLHDAFQNVRGDSGKWNDEPRLQHAPPTGRKPARMSLDDWADQLLKKDVRVTKSDDNWLLFHTRQLDDNDRVWVERIERRGDQFTIVANEAVWQGRYRKNFTYYDVIGVNLGKLDPGEYEAKWIIKPLEFQQFEGDGRPRDNWSKDERPAGKEPIELTVRFTVSK